MNVFAEPTKEQNAPTWADINWHAVENNVRRLQERIYCATKNEDWRKVKNLQKLLARATSNKLLAIRRVTQENQGKHTAGIDGVLCDTPAKRLQLYSAGLSLKGYKPKAVRRVYIPKHGGRRPLGIPTVKDRVMQTLVKAALEPEWEARFEANSYGFRPGRCTMDAIEALHTTLNQKGASTFILDADIKGCFDNLAHEPLLARLPVFTTTIRRWLKAGVVELGHYSTTETGSPQGGPLSPLLANVALDGMERLFGAETSDGRPITPSQRKGLNRGISLCRYADDFVATAPTREVLEDYVMPQLTEFLRERGLALSAAKTRIVHVSQGFNFLGFLIRRFGRKLLSRPQKEKVLVYLHRIKTFLNSHKQYPAAAVIRHLNPLIRGWANYYRHCAANKTYSYVGHRQWQMLWSWAKRRHPNKGKWWIKQRYFRADGYWTFYSKDVELVRITATPIRRFVKVSGRNSPFDPKLRTYWQARTKRWVSEQTASQQKLALLKTQQGKCCMCGLLFVTTTEAHIHHVIPQVQGGSEDLSNKRVVHYWCHQQYHQRFGSTVLKACAG